MLRARPSLDDYRTFIYFPTFILDLSNRYFLACTLTTVGFGDFSPQSQDVRLAAIFFLPFGLIVISFGIANVQAFANSQRSKIAKRTEGSTTRVTPKAQESVTPNQTEPPVPGKLRSAWDRAKETLAVQIVFLLRDYAIVILFGVLFFYFNEREQRLQEQRRDVDMTLVDALYLATVTATTVGYGHHVWPVSGGAKLFMIFYFFASTGVVGAAIGNISSLYIERKRENINAKLMYVVNVTKLLSK